MQFRFTGIAAAALVLGLCVVAATVSDYGIGWDESPQASYGELSYEYFASGGEDTRANEFLDLYLYGPSFELAAAALYAHDIESKYLIRHWLIAIAGLLTILAVARIGLLFELPLTALFAALLLALIPRFYGHAFINSKDLPFACAMAWSLLSLLRFIESRGKWKWSVLFGLASGAVLSLRPGGAPLLVLLFAATMFYARSGRLPGRQLLLRGAAALGIAWLVMIAFWPWAHQSPVLNPLRAMSAALAFPTAYEVLFDGVVTASDSLPRSYFVHLLAVTTPPLVLMLALPGLVLCGRDAWRARGEERESASALASFVVPLWLLLPLLFAALLRPNVYDGIRHLLFVLPAIALLGGRAAAEALRAIEVPRTRRLVGAALLVTICSQAWIVVRLHPYQMTYFNGFAGGLSGAAGRYETDYWVTSYREAAEWVNERAAQRPGGLRVIAAVDGHSQECLAHYLNESVELIALSEAPQAAAIPDGFDYYVSTTRYGLDRRYPGSPIAHEIGREGAVFTVIREAERAAPRSAVRSDTAQGVP